jgi:PIN domain nuclease of toxin-antitoxin system
MKILADTNLFLKFCRRLPLPEAVQSAFEDERNELFLASVSGLELYRLWQGGRVPDHPDTWIEKALPGWTVIPMNFSIARESALWPWDHRDPADRILAATAKLEKIELWHTDTVLKKLSGFPQRYFKNVALK